MKLGDKIYALCRLRGLKVAELARQTGIPSQRFSDWKESTEDRPRTPTLAQALRVARVLRVPLDYLADDAQSEPPPEEDEGLKEVLNKVRRLGAEEVNRRIDVAAPMPVHVARPLGTATVPTPEPSPSRDDAPNHHKRAKR